MFDRLATIKIAKNRVVYAGQLKTIMPIIRGLTGLLSAAIKYTVASNSTMLEITTDLAGTCRGKTVSEDTEEQKRAFVSELLTDVIKLEEAGKTALRGGIAVTSRDTQTAFSGPDGVDREQEFTGKHTRYESNVTRRQSCLTV